MIVFVPVDDGCATAAFFNTVDDRFIESPDGSHAFNSLYEVDEVDRVVFGAPRLRSLLPPDFFEPKPDKEPA